MDWTEKYRPRTLSEVVGNAKAVEELRAWAQSWTEGQVPKTRAVVLAGEPGVGKTTSAHALARDMGWGVVELNASDSRNYDAVKRIAGTGAVHAAFTEKGEFAEHGRQLVILDEADNLFGNEDRGGMRAINETIRIARQPIVLIVNDLYALTRRGGALKDLALTIKFTRVHTRSIPKALRRIAESEGFELEAGVAESLAEKSGGDLRGAVNDLQAISFGRDTVSLANVKALGDRDKSGDVWGLLGKVFYKRGLDEPRKAAFELDETPDTIALWIDENIPILYTDKADMVDAYAALSRADVYLGRTFRRQQYALWSYATSMMTGGVSLAKHAPPTRARFQFPSWMRKMSSARRMREIRDSAARKVGEYTHTSKARAREEYFPGLRVMMQRDDGFAAFAAHAFDLDDDEVAFFLEVKADSARVRRILEGAARFGVRSAAETATRGGLAGFGRPGLDEESDEVEEAVTREDPDADGFADEAPVDEEAAEGALAPGKGTGKPGKGSSEKDEAKKQKSLFEF